MLFVEALKALKEGKQVVRQSWAKDGGYLVLLPNTPYIWKVLIQGEKTNAGGYPFLVEDYDAEDWKLWSDVCAEEDSEVEVDVA